MTVWRDGIGDDMHSNGKRAKRPLASPENSPGSTVGCVKFTFTLTKVGVHVVHPDGSVTEPADVAASDAEELDRLLGVLRELEGVIAFYELEGGVEN